MRQMKRRIFAGAVCEQIVYRVREGNDPKRSAPRLRFRDEAERRAHRDAISRRNLARLINENYTPASWYCTLTFDTAHECHTFKEAKAEMVAYRRRLKRLAPSLKAVIVMGRGKGHGARIHLHMIIDGVSEEQIRREWRGGTVVECKHLRKSCKKRDGTDVGRDYTGLANYLFDHWTPEQGGKRWSATRNHRRAEAEEPVETKRVYSVERPPKAPKGYRITEAVETVFGYYYYKYVAITPEDKSNQKRGRSDRPCTAL